MSIRFIEGFEGYGTTDGNSGTTIVRKVVEAKWTGKFSEAGGPRIYNGWHSGKGFTVGRTGPYNFIVMTFGAGYDEVVVGFAYKPRRAAIHLSQLLCFSDSREAFGDGGGHVSVDDRYGTSLSIWRPGSGLFAHVENCMIPNRWHYIEMRVKVHDTLGEIELKINGVQKVNLTNQDTRNGGPLSQITNIWFIAQTSLDDSYAGACIIDDVYGLDTAGGTHTTFLGPIKIEGLYPSAEGDNIDFTPSTGTDNSALVDENPTNLTDYNSSSTSGHRDLLAMDNLSIITTDVKCLQLNVDFLVTKPSPYGLKPTVKSGGTEYDGDQKTTADDEDYVSKWHIWDQDPFTAAAWTVANINAVQAGYELV